MAKICLSLTESTLQRDLELADKYRKHVDLLELRVDFLDPDERLFVRKFPGLAGIPTILTIRRAIDGGRFRDGEGARLVLFGKALAFADPEAGKNFAYIDLEDDFYATSLEESARTFGTTIIRSFHDFGGVPPDLAERIARLPRNGDEVAKAVVMARGLDDVRFIFRAANEFGPHPKIIIAMGEYGTSTRILADRIGSLLTYSSPSVEGNSLAGPGQIDPETLALIYRPDEITPETRSFGVMGSDPADTSLPRIFNAAFVRSGIDAVYIPFKTDGLDPFFALAEELQLEGVSVESPFKEAVIPYLSDSDAMVADIGSCNAIVSGPSGWTGYNTDATGFRKAVMKLTGKSNLKGVNASVIGAGGAARAVVAVLTNLGAGVCILNRTPIRAKRLADTFGCSWAGLDGNGLDRLSEHSDLIVQASAAGSGPNLSADPLDFYEFTGDETVFELANQPPKTRLLARAEAAGCRTMNGELMLLEEAKIQFKLFTGVKYP